MNFYNKYLKYKNKYINLKTQIGGCEEIIKNINLDKFFEGYNYVEKIATAERGGSVHIIEKDTKKYILKIIEGETNEINIQKLASELNIGPKIYNTLIKKCESNGKIYTYIIMEKLNMTLKQYVLDNKNLPEIAQNKIKEIFNIMHSNNILHNDATSSNWMFDGDDFNTLVLIDFGDSDIKRPKKEEILGDINFLLLSLKYSAKLEEDKMKILKDYLVEIK